MKKKIDGRIVRALAHSIGKGARVPKWSKSYVIDWDNNLIYTTNTHHIAWASLPEGHGNEGKQLWDLPKLKKSEDFVLVDAKSGEVSVGDQIFKNRMTIDNTIPLGERVIASIDTSKISDKRSFNSKYLTTLGKVFSEGYEVDVSVLEKAIYATDGEIYFYLLGLNL